MAQQMISLTEGAATQIKNLMASAPAGQPVLGLRIGVKAGGCSGMSYFMEYATEKNPMEDVIEDKGARLFVDPSAMMYLIGSEMDYNASDFEAGFTFRNPNVTGSCGCGKSFKTE